MAKFSEDSARRNSMLRLIVLTMMSWKTIVVVIMFVSVTKPEAKQNYTLGFLLANKTRDQPAFSYFPAIQVALNDIKNDESLLPNINLNWVYNDTECDKHVAIRKHLWQLNNKVDAFFGPSCHCVTPANVATAFDKPLMSYRCADSELVNKTSFPTVVRTFSQDKYVSPAVIALLRQFKWKRVALVVQVQKEPEWNEKVKRHLKIELEKSNITVSREDKIRQCTNMKSNSSRGLSTKGPCSSDIIKSVTELHKHARVVILLMSPTYVQEYMLVAREKKLVTERDNQEYVFVGFRLDFLFDDNLKFKWYYNYYIDKGDGNSSCSSGKEDKERRMRSFSALLMMRVRQRDSESYSNFKNEVVRIGRDGPAPFNNSLWYRSCRITDIKTVNKCVRWSNSSSQGSSEEKKNCTKYIQKNITYCKYRYEDPPKYALYLYDAVYQYAYALNATLAENLPPTGRNIAKKLRLHTFLSKTGYKISFDNNSDVMLNLTLLSQQPDTSQPSNCRPFVPEKPCQIMKPLAEFWLDPKDGKQTYKSLVKEGVTYRWLTNIRDTPKCGFKNEKCQVDSSSDSNKAVTIVVGVAAALVIVLLLLLLNVYRQYHHAKKLQSYRWKIDPDELAYTQRRRSQSSIGSDDWVALVQDRSSNHTQPMDVAVNNCQSSCQTSTFSTIGSFKDNYVAIKKLSKKTVDVTPKVLKELNLMRDVRHDNLNPFIGACVEPTKVCIVTNYCQRGSLQDILENEDVKIDHMFILALVYDIVKGMTFLHGSEIKIHGNLKSSNCLVDSRWQLKLADYGLTTFKSKQTKRCSCQHEYYRGLLWKAPEFLQCTKPEELGSQLGDVYSFGIILQEFHTRKGPYSNNYHEDVAEIIERVKARESPSYRPVIPGHIDKLDDLRELAKECWADMPQKRPTFSEVKRRVDRLLSNNKMKTNILDNMVYMMEKYSDNLEDLVNERTGQLMDEKKKTDALLQRMLPPSIAEQLKRGTNVEAESFSCVTIYFSDIVSFTELCAESTPLQVVTLLNDLYTLFDEIIGEFDVYKVETIGDAYMVVSGLPQTNGNLHASEICCMAIHIRDSVQDFKIRHKPNYKLKLRIGIHSGPVVAGVVGRTMPRYCLFGDTVNTASRLESSSEALRIHVSSSTKDILDELRGFLTEERGKIPLKGKGLLLTFWLLGADTCVPRSPQRPAMIHDFPLMEDGVPGSLFMDSNTSLCGSLHGSRCGSRCGSRRGSKFESRRGSKPGSFRKAFQGSFQNPARTFFEDCNEHPDSPVLVRSKEREDELVPMGVLS